MTFRFFGKVLIDHLVFYVSNRHLSIQTLKIFLKYPTTQCTIVIAEGQRWSSTDLETYYQRYLGIKSKNKISVRWNNCFDIHWQIFKYIISLISPATKKCWKCHWMIQYCPWPWKLPLWDTLHIHRFSENVYKHSPNN